MRCRGSADIGMLLAVLSAIVLVTVVAVVPMPIYRQALKMSVAEAPTQLTSKITPKLLKYIPLSLARNAFQDPRSTPYAYTQHQIAVHRLSVFAYKLLSSFVLLIPWRMLALLPYITVLAIIWLTLSIRHRILAKRQEYVIDIEESGSIAEVVPPLSWVGPIRWLCVLMICLPLPIPIWLPGGLFFMSPLLVHLSPATKRFPAPPGE